MTDLVSVIITAFNAEKLIQRAVNSVLSQTYKDIEIIIVSDDLVDYKKSLENSGVIDKKIKYFSTNYFGSGQANAINIGIKQANSNYIANLDFDDEFHPERIEILLPLVKKYGAATSGLNFIDDYTGLAIENLSTEYQKDYLLFNEFLFATTHCYTNIFFDKSKIQVEFFTAIKLVMDFITIAKMYDSIDFFGYSSQKLLNYYRRAGSLCNSENSVNNFISDYQNAITLIKDNKIQLNKESTKSILLKYLSK